MTELSPQLFEDLVGRASGLGPDNAFVQAAIFKEAKERRKLPQERAQAVADRAQEMARGYMPAPRDEDSAWGAPSDRRTNAEAALISNALARRLKPWAKDLRKRCFAVSDPPFREWSDAVAWIKAEVETDRDNWKAAPATTGGIEAEIRRLADLGGLEVKTQPRSLRYYVPGKEYTHLAPAFPGTVLEELARETNRVSEETAFHPAVLTAFVLCGAAPAISRVRITRSAKTCRTPGDRIPSRWVTIRFNAGDVTDPELRSLYKDVREFFGAVNRERLTWPEAEFLFLVDGMGGWPSENKTTFWEKVLRAWKEHPSSQYLSLNSWRAVRNKYERLAQRANLRELMTQDPPPPPPSQAELAETRERAEEIALLLNDMRQAD